MSSIDEIDTGDAEAVLKQVFENKKRLCEILNEEYVQIDPKFVYDNFKAMCNSINDEPITPKSSTKEKLNLDVYDEIFKKYDEMDAALTAPKLLASTGQRGSQKLNRMNSTFAMDRTGIRCSMLNINATVIESSSEAAMKINGESPVAVDDLMKVTEEMLIEFNNMKIPTFDELQKDRVGPEIRELLSKFSEQIKSLHTFFSKLKEASKVSNSEPIEDNFPSLNNEFCTILKTLSKSLREVDILKQNENIFDINIGDDDIQLVSHDNLSEILQKYTYDF